MASLITVGQIIDSSLDHYRKHFKELLAISLWLVVASIPSIVGQLLTPFGGDGTRLVAADWITFVLTLLGGILVIIVSLWMYATLVLAIDEQAKGKRTSIKDLSRIGWKKFLPYLLLTLLLAAIFIGMALIVAPGLILIAMSGIKENAQELAGIGAPLFLIGGLVSLILIAKYGVELSFAPYILLLENKTPTQAVKMSSALVKGRWWSTLLRFAVPKLIYFLLIFLAQVIIFTALGFLMSIAVGSTAGALLVGAVTLLMGVLIPVITTPIIIATDYYLYDSLEKTR